MFVGAREVVGVALHAANGEGGAQTTKVKGTAR